MGDGQFWADMVSGLTAPTPLTVDRMATHPTTPPAAFQEIACPVENAGADLWVSLWALLLARYSGEQDILVGVVVGGALRPFRTHVAWHETFEAWRAANNRRLQDMVSRTAPDLDALRAAAGWTDPVGLVDSMVVPADEQADPAYPVALRLAAHEHGLRIDYSQARFAADRIEALLGHLVQLHAAVCRAPRTQLGWLPLLTPHEHQRILVDWNDTQTPFPHDRCMHELVEVHASRRPDAIALITDAATLTYRELNARANRLARHLVDCGAQIDMPVGISVNRGPQMVIGLLAIAKAGAGYVPLDPTYPAERLGFLVQDSGVRLLLTDAESTGLFDGVAVTTINLDDAATRAACERCSADDPHVNVQPHHLAYLIYTSGSTGNPKGVMLDHRGRVNNLYEFTARYDVREGDRVLALSSLSFDMSVYEVFGTLGAGAAIVMDDAGRNPDPRRWAQKLVEHRVTIWNTVPALLDMLVTHLEDHEQPRPPSLRAAFLGGDWIPLTLPQRLRAVAGPDVTVVALGGATEVSIHSTIFEVGDLAPDWNSIPYGMPMRNQRAYVLDPRLQPLPVGVPGELYLGGIGVGRGYHNRPELTASRFLPNPFVDGERLYRTGDLCKWRADGNLEMLGRADFQVKIRGLRVELGEIEAALRNHPQVAECVVLAREDSPGDQRLVAYVISSQAANDQAATHAAAIGGDTAPTHLVTSMRNHLRNVLPAYMVPSAIVRLDAFPLTPNGKIDRRSLPVPEWTRPELDVPFVPGGNPVEQAICRMWTEALQLDRVGILDEFTALGGSSLVATRLLSELRDIFGIDLELKHVLGGTPRALAEALAASCAGTGTEAAELAALYLEVWAMSADEIERNLEPAAGAL